MLTSRHLLIGLVLTLTSCYSLRYEDGRRIARPVEARPVKLTHSFWIFGVFGEARVRVRDHCPATGVAAIVNESDGWDLVASIATLGLWTPRSVLLLCAARVPTPAPPHHPSAR